MSNLKHGHKQISSRFFVDLLSPSRKNPVTPLELLLLDSNLSFTVSPPFAKIHNMTVLKLEGQKYKKSTNIFQNCASINTGCDVKKQHIQSDMKAISICHLS